MFFAACSTDDDDNGPSKLPVPAPGDLPGLPDVDEIMPIVSRAEAEALLSGLKEGFGSFRGEVEDLIEGKIETTPIDSGVTQTWNIKDNTDLSGLKINAVGDSTQRATLSLDGTAIPKPGDYMEMSENRDAAVEFTGNRTEGGATVYSGSRIAEKARSYGKVTIKSIDAAQSGSITVYGSGSAEFVYSLTASSGGKSGKIIFEAGIEGSMNRDLDISDEVLDNIDELFGELPFVFSGSLTVYGADDAELYREDIANADDFTMLAEYFNLDY
jgi:hypothetical protein